MNEKHKDTAVKKKTTPDETSGWDETHPPFAPNERTIENEGIKNAVGTDDGMDGTREQKGAEIRRNKETERPTQNTSRSMRPEPLLDGSWEERRVEI